MTDVALSDVKGIVGLQPVEIPVTKYLQGQRIHYHAALPISQAVRLIQRPDPSRPFPGNRKVDPSRARKFAGYLIKNKDWISPSLLVRVPRGEVIFDVKARLGHDVSWGVLTIPLDVLSAVTILDGQHRTLGLFNALETLNADISKARDLCESLAAHGADEEIQKEQYYRLQTLLNERHRVSEECISIELVEVNDEQSAQIFGDINNNAKGVNPDFTTVLDRRDVINRVAMELIESHPLLRDRVELGQGGRMSVANPHLLGARAVADITRTVLIGTGRLSPRMFSEIEASPSAAVGKVSLWLNILLDSFVELQDIMNGTLSPRELRERTMLGSSTMLRSLAACYHATVVEPDGGRPLTLEQYESFLKKLAGSMRRIPIQSDDRFWLDTGAFVEGAKAPLARQGSYKALTDALTAWARGGLPKGR